MGQAPKRLEGFTLFYFIGLNQAWSWHIPLRNGRASTIKLTCRTKSGTFLPTEISLHKLEIDGETRILGLVQDRSEHRQRVPG